MRHSIEVGIVDIWIDEIVPCLKENETGELKETVVFKIESRSYLRAFKEENGWGINWNQIPDNIEVYALALKDNNEIQGLVGLKNDMGAHAVYIHWACVAPQNNPNKTNRKKYDGVGGHLFAIAVDKSVAWGHYGAVHGYAASHKLLEHYISVFGAEYLGMQHKYHFFINENAGARLLEVYHYEWNEA